MNGIERDMHTRRDGVPSAWNEFPQLGGFVPIDTSGESLNRTPITPRSVFESVRNGIAFMLSGSLVAPAQAPSHMSEHYHPSEPQTVRIPLSDSVLVGPVG